MRSNQKGFTLIELLAVIVILAIIALIATPVVLNIIDKARLSAAQDSVYGVMSAIRLAYTESLLDVNSIELPFKVECNTSGTTGTCTYANPDTTNTTPVTLSFSGTAPTDGTFTLERETGKFAATDDIVVNGKYCSIAAGTNTVTCSSSASSAGSGS